MQKKKRSMGEYGYFLELHKYIYSDLVPRKEFDKKLNYNVKSLLVPSFTLANLESSLGS